MPSLSTEQLRRLDRDFSNYRRYGVEVRGERISVDGATATVTCEIVRSYRDEKRRHREKRRGERVSSPPQRFRLDHRASGIAGMRSSVAKREVDADDWRDAIAKTRIRQTEQQARRDEQRAHWIQPDAEIADREIQMAGLEAKLSHCDLTCRGWWRHLFRPPAPAAATATSATTRAARAGLHELEHLVGLSQSSQVADRSAKDVRNQREPWRDGQVEASRVIELILQRSCPAAHPRSKAVYPTLTCGDSLPTASGRDAVDLGLDAAGAEQIAFVAGRRAEIDGGRKAAAAARGRSCISCARRYRRDRWRSPELAKVCSSGLSPSN